MTNTSNPSDLWSNVAKNYSATLTPYDQELGQQVLNITQEIKIKKRQSILELGSGSGHLSLILAQNGYRVSLLDQNSAALEQSRKIFHSHHLPCQLINHDLFKLSDLSNKYDFIWNSGVMEHFNDTELSLALKQIRNKTTKYFFFIVPNPASLPYLIWKFSEINQGSWPYGQEYLRSDYSPFLHQAGFKVIKQTFLGQSHTDFFLEKISGSSYLTKIYSQLLNNGFVSPHNFYLKAYLCQPTKIPSRFHLPADNTETITQKFQTLAEITQIATISGQNDPSPGTIRSLQNEIVQKNFQLNQIYQSRIWKLLTLYKGLCHLPLKLFQKFTPLWLRKRIKNTLSRSFPGNIHVEIPPEIINEWSLWSQRRSPSSFDILNFSIIAWDFRFQRPQHLCRELSLLGHQIFYIKNEFFPYSGNTDLAPFKLEKKFENIYEITLAASKNLFIYHDQPSPLDKKIILASIKNLILQAKIINPVAKIDHPFWGFIQKNLSAPSFYDCMDNHQGFSDSGKNISILEKHLFQNCDFSLVSSNYLEKTAKSNHAKKIIKIKNAGEFQHFFPASENYFPLPEDIKQIPHPIIGYYGAIADWFDTEIFQNIVQLNPQFSFVLIGQVSNQKVENIASKYSHVYLLGEKKYTDLPAYLQCFDVCLIPFIINNLIKATHPVKIFEYFAAGKPVVSTKIPEILEYHQLVHFADKKTFSSQIHQALKEPMTKKTSRQLIAKANTWAKRVEIIDRQLQVFFPKVSIIILVYNNYDLTKKTIDSIIERSFYPNFELIIVDNASETSTQKMLKTYTKYPNVKLILNSQNFGFSAGNNIGIKEATGDYLILINNDVLITPGWINRLVFHASQPGVGLVGPVTNSIGNEAKINISYHHHHRKSLEKAALNYTSRHWGNTISLNRIAAFCWIESKTTLRRIGLLDERFGRGLFEDDDYCYRVKKAGLEILCAEDVFVHHFGGASFKKLRSKELDKIFKTNKKLFEKKWHTTWIPHQYRHH